jgi:hypothetical protein
MPRERLILDAVAAGVTVPAALPSRITTIWCTGSAEILHHDVVIATISTGERKVIDGLFAAARLEIRALENDTSFWWCG